MDRLQGAVRHYAWGSRTAIADLLGTPQPTDEPEAELWFGAYPAAPAYLVSDGRSLLDVIEADPSGALGEQVIARYGKRLPFLLKVLAVEAPLSLQAHPSPEQARAGFAAEEAAGVARDAPHRLYKDASHKPELVCALTRFEGLCGFRPVRETLALAEVLDCAPLGALLSPLRTRADDSGLRDVFGALMTMSTGPLLALIDSAVSAAASASADAPGDEVTAAPWRGSLHWLGRLAAAYPGDPGVVGSLLLNYVQLEPGEAVFMPAGRLHAYLAGMGIEVMASSDNVLRGGLTPKHVAVDELVRTLSFRPGPAPVILPEGEPEMVYPAPAAEFRLSLLHLVAGGPLVLGSGRPQILLCADGGATATSGDSRLVLGRGDAVFVAAADPPVTLVGAGSVFRATVGEA